MKQIETVLVVGAGTMGHGFAQLFAQNDLSVRLVDISPELLEKAKGWISDNLHFMVEIGELPKDRVEPIIGHIEVTTDLERAIEGVDFVLEAVVEDLKVKQDVFRATDAKAPPDVVLATNTSAIEIDEISAVTRNPQRVIGSHWFNPPQIVPAVEVIPSSTTSQETLYKTMNFLKSIGKVPTIIKSTPGFVANRIQFAMAAEAWAIAEEGIASPEDIDQIVKTSFGFRLGSYGPFEIADMAGLDTYYHIFEYLYEKLNKEIFVTPKMLRELFEKGCYGVKSNRGLYEYEPGASERLKRERNKKLYARLRAYRAEEEAAQKGKK